MNNSVLKALKISKNSYWVGAVDWGIRDFHGYSTNLGTTYNAFLILADKITLIDTVKSPFQKELLSRISSIIDPRKIDYIVSNHSEMDHSGCLTEMIELIEPEKVFASKAGMKALQKHFQIDFKITPVKTGDEINLGNKTISFIETPMLHWPDSMFTYLHEEGVLFSQDAFGMHLASNRIFADENPIETLEWEAEKYFANILLLYSKKILQLLDNVKTLNLPIKMICPDHGPIWRKNLEIPLNWYRKWSLQKPELKAIVVYDTMWQSTGKMAIAIGEGIISTGVEVKISPLASGHRSDIATEILNAGALVVGAPTLNNQLFPSVADLLTYLKGLKPQNLIGAAFGSYGWSGESVKQINEYLNDMNAELVSEGLKVKYVPTNEDLQKCVNLGKLIGDSLKKKING